MIAFIQGTLLTMAETECVVLTAGGVGYAVHVTRSEAARLPGVGEAVAFHVATVVREDAFDLYGFATEDERRAFFILISISKLGPKTALALLSQYGPEDLRRIVAEEDVAALTRVSGIGKKTAQHIFLELKYKLGAGSGLGTPLGAGPGGAGGPGGVFRDVVAAMGNLGYVEDEIAPVVDKVLRDEPDLDVSGALRAALKAMAKRRA